MSNSPMVSYVAFSPNHSGARRYPITRITIHYMGGPCSVETCGEIFRPTSRMASSNYGIGPDGRVALYVDEANRAWTSGNGDNDNRAVTIEVANNYDSSITQAAWDSLVELCADICRRNGIEHCTYTGDTDGVLTMHKWFQSTDCPGPWLSARFGQIADEVEAKLHGPKKRVGWYCEDGFWYHNNTEGEHDLGWFWDDDYKNWFNFDADGKMRTGWYHDPEDGNWYCLDERGLMRTGWFAEQGGDGRTNYYYLYPAAVTDADGTKHPKGSMARSQVVTDGGKAYSISESGIMDRGKMVEVSADMSGALHAM